MRSDPIALLPAEAPILLVVVDTEEEFDWEADFDRGATSVRHLRRIDRAQRLFDAYGIRPAYVVDYPVAAQPAGVEPLREIALSGRAVIGAHLHPWVSPPCDEALSRRNTYPGNLPRALEAEKLRRLAVRIAESFGSWPTIYKAGRYGIGPNTAPILEELGFEIDLSPAPPMDFSADGGPDFSHHRLAPCWIGRERRLLSIPSTGAYVGALHRAGPWLYRQITRPSWRRARLPGILSRLRLLDRLRLSPEGHSAREMQALTQALFDRGQRLFVFSFHSPSVEPGHTTYVRSEAELAAFLDSCRRYFDFFHDRLGGRSMTPLEFRDRCRAPERRGAGAGTAAISRDSPLSGASATGSRRGPAPPPGAPRGRGA